VHDGASSSSKQRGDSRHRPAAESVLSRRPASRTGRALRAQSRGGRRSRLRSVRRFFASRRRCSAPRLGLVGLRNGAGGRRASATTSASRARAASLLRNCARCSDAVIVSIPSTIRPLARSRSCSRCTGERTEDPATSHTSSTRESAVFTPCPPGPDERENRQESSDSGIVSPASTRRPGRWAAGIPPSSSFASILSDPMSLIDRIAQNRAECGSIYRSREDEARATAGRWPQEGPAQPR